jgi:hypothetical protein
MVALLLGGVISAAMAQQSISVELSPASNAHSDMLSAVAFGTALAAWVSEHDSDPDRVGAYPLTAAAMHGALKSQLRVWREVESAGDNRYMEDLVKIDDAGFLQEYVRRFHPDLPNDVAVSKEQMDAFAGWLRTNRIRPRPRIEARLVFSRD